MIDEDEIDGIIEWYDDKGLSIKSDHSWRFIASNNEKIVELESMVVPTR